MKRAIGFQVSPGFLKFYVALDDINDIKPRFDLLNRGRRHNLSLAYPKTRLKSNRAFQAREENRFLFLLTRRRPENLRRLLLR